jgi:hypothetical protein
MTTTEENKMSLHPVALAMLNAIQVAYPEAVTIEPKDATDELALNQLRDAEYIDLYDMWPNGDRRWTATGLGRGLVLRS